jgi:reactive chlorine resistance protein C
MNCENEMNTTTTTTSSLKDTRGFVRHMASVTDNFADRIEMAGRHSVRYGLVLVLAWIGAMKFTAYEAAGISGFVSSSPLMSWAYQVFSQRQFSAILGVAELLTATLIALRPFSAKLSAAGSALAIGTFLTTLTFLFSTPGVIEPSLGFPALSAVPGQFLIKDVVLLGAAIWTAGEALRTVRREGM